jgi:ubiquitin-conjugating enzyme E2 R
MASQGLKSRLMTEFKELSKEKWCNIEVRFYMSIPSIRPADSPQLKDGNLMTWTIGLMVINSDSYYDGGYFKVCSISFSSLQK